MQMLLFLFIVLFLLFIIALFAFPAFSPIPYFPTNKYDLPAIIKALNLKKDQVILDLGAGDGIVIFCAASMTYKQKLNTQFVAIDINPILIIILYIRRLLHPNRKNIKIIWGDMFEVKLKSQNSKVKSITIYLYISPWLLEKAVTKIKKDFKNFSASWRIVSYFYPVKSLKAKEKIIIGKNRIYSYFINSEAR